MSKQFAATLSNVQFSNARIISDELGVSISQVVKAYERGETARINEWKAQLKAKREGNQNA